MTGSGFQLYQNQAKNAGIFQATRFALWNIFSMPFTMTVSIAWNQSELDHRGSFAGILSCSDLELAVTRCKTI